MKKRLALLMASLFLIVGTVWAQAPVATPEEAIAGLLNRIGGNGAADKFEIVIDANLAENGKDVFVITSQNGKPCIKGNTQLSVATGINWYLNHYAHINLTWNNLTTDLSAVTLPVPAGEEKHVSSAKYRYNFNTCTFSYSMAFWTWERWQQEIDWMALHGINAPLNLVGLDVVTRKFLKELGVSDSDINAYIAGPGFIAWFAMNNLEGWGGTINAKDVTMNGNPDWWYTRQENLCRNMLQRMRELGMQPVIPGFSGQVPDCIRKYDGQIDGFSSAHVLNNGTWAGGYTRPDMLYPNTTTYEKFAEVYYKHLHDVMGVSEFYSIDPFHEGGKPNEITNEDCYPNIMKHLDIYHDAVDSDVKNAYRVNSQAKWIIQYWQDIPQSGAFSSMNSDSYKDRFIGLDLFADNIYDGRAAKWQEANISDCYYKGRPYIYCMLHNFGGRSGLHGRLETTMNGYFDALAKGNNCQGIGATPEGIETNPILYDMLFELPWMDANNRPTADKWLEDYAYARYGVDKNTAPQSLSALQYLKESVWNCQRNQQGTSEAIILGRPRWTFGDGQRQNGTDLEGTSVSSWSKSSIYWDTQFVLQAADDLYAIIDKIETEDGRANFDYDFIDVVRQSMVDQAAQLLPLIKNARNSGNNTEYERLYKMFLQLMLDLDEMLSYDENFKLERWTSLARNIAGEATGTSVNDRNWLEWNARTQVSVWSFGNSGLNDYSNRCWAGLIKDFHYPRWKYFFENNGAIKDGNWFTSEKAWTVDFTNYDYSTVTIPEDMTATEKAAETFSNYFGRVKGATKNYIFPMGVTTNATKSEVTPAINRGQTVDLPLIIGKDVEVSSVWVDLNNDGAKGNGETLTVTDNQVAIPANATIGKTTAQVVYSDGTDITFSLALIEDITVERTVTAVAGANGSVAIEGTNELSVTNTDAVKMTATANTGYNFKDWTDANGYVVSNDNPYIYYGKEAATFTANFIQDKWGVPTEDKSDWSNTTVQTSFVNQITFAYHNREPETIYEASVAPENLFNTIPQIINVPQGASFDISWSDDNNNGLKYCYLSAYYDYDGDGVFELLETKGKRTPELANDGSNNLSVCEGKINVLLPYDAPLGITHMRLRFDGGWKTQNFDASTKAYDAKAQLNRMCYELIINVTEGSDKAAHIVVESNNDEWGTAEVWTEETPGWTASNEWDVSTGIDVKMKATKASDDVEFLGWYDHYGRLLTTELAYSMKAREDATYTAKFRKELEIDGWVFEYRTEPGVVILTSVRQSGNHDLVIPETVEILGEQCKIVGLDNGVFNNNKDLWSITMPKSMEFLSEKSLLNHTLTGNGNTQTFDVDIKNNEGWRITMDVERTGTLTGWGACLLASGNTPAKGDYETYAEGFQFYLQCTEEGAERDKLIIKTKTQIYDSWYFDDVYQQEKFTVIIEYNGAQQLSVNVLKADGTNATNHNGTQEPIVFTDCTIQDIKQLCTNVQAVITANVKIDKTAEANPFSGCSNLGSIAFSEACANYYVAQDGDLYNSSNVLICSPEGKNKADAIRTLGELIDNTKALMDDIATSIDPIGKATEIALSTTVGENYYIWCNAPQAGDEGNVGRLLDNTSSTFFHSNWESTTPPADGLDHHLTIEKVEGIETLKFHYQARTGSGLGDYPTTIKVQGSNNGTDYTDIAIVQPRNANGGTIENGAEWTSEKIGNGNRYAYLRFMVTATTTNKKKDGHIYWHMAEFDLFKLTSVVEVVEEYKEHADITNDEAANVYDKLVNALYVYNNGGTAEEMQAVYNALEPLYTALNDKKNKFEYVREINELVPATEELINAIATSVDPVGKATEITLSTTEDSDYYIWCNNPHTGDNADARGGVAALLDEDPNTYLHTNYSSVSSTYDYLQIDNVNPEDLRNFKIAGQQRAGGDYDRPKMIEIFGSNNNNDWTSIVTVTGLPNTQGGTWTSEALTSGANYAHYKFVVKTHTNENNVARPYFHMAKFDLFKLTSVVEVAPAYKNFGGITNEEATTAYDNMVKAQALCTTGTATELEAALEALRTSYETLNAKKGTVLNGVYHINYDGGDLFVAYAEANTLTDLTGNQNAGFRLFDAKVDNSGTGNDSGDTDENHKVLQNNAIAAKVAADELFTIVPNNEGTGYLISAQGLYMEPVGKTSEWCIQDFDTNVANAGIYLIEEASDGAFKLKCANPHREEGWGLTEYVNDWGPVFGNDRLNKANLSTFKFNPVTEYTLTVPASGYAAVCLPFNVVLPEGVEAYDINSLEKQNLVSGEVLAKIAGAGGIVMAGTPMVVKATAGDHTLGITMESEGAKTSLEGSVLRGNFVKQNLAVDANKKYVLNGDVWTLLEEADEIPANTCWIEATDIDYDYNIDMTPEFVEIDGWKFRYEPQTNGIMLTDAALDGNGVLVIPATVTVGGEEKKVVAIAPDFLHGNETLTSITIPETMVNLGFRKVEPMFGDDTTVYEGAEGDGGVYEGNKEISQVGAHTEYVFPIDPVTGAPFMVESSFAWRLTLDVTIDDPELNFNNYGSAIVSTNENSLLDSYTDGDMQIYLKAGHKDIMVKIDNADDRYRYTLPELDANGKETGELVAHSHFIFELEHDGSGGYQVVVYYDDGRAKMYNISASEGAKVKDFDRVYYSLPKGIRVKVKVEKLISEGLFVGCTNLHEIIVDDANPTFKSCNHGVLYDKNGYYVMRIPEGETSHHFDIPSKVVKLYAGAVHGVNADIVLHSNPQIGVVDGHEEAVANAKFYLSLDDIDGTIEEGETGYGGARDFISTNTNTYLAARYKRAPLKNAEVFGTICLPFVPENATAKYDFFELTSSNEGSLTFTQVDQLEANEPYIYRLKATPEEASELSGDEVFGTDESGNDIFETNTSFTVVTKDKYDPTQHKAGKCEALGSFVNYFVETVNYPNSYFYLYTSSDNMFHRVTQKLTYRPYRAFFVVTPEEGQAAQAPSLLNLVLLDGTTTSIDASLVEGMEAPEYYDLSGRRVLNPVSGGIYIVNGKKIVIK